MSDVLPARLAAAPVGGSPGGRPAPALVLGEVFSVTHPDDKRSSSKRWDEYGVLASIDGVTIPLYRCYIASSFGSVAGAKGQPGVGAKVLVALLGGDRTTGWIVGGIRDAREETDPKEIAQAGHHLTTVFNGVSLKITDDGALEVRRDGPTRADGTLDEDRIKPEQTGASVRLDADGGIALATRAEDGDAQQRIVIDHKAKTISVAAEEGYAVEVHGTATIHAARGITISVDDGGIAITADGGDVTVSAPSGKILLGDGADEPLVLGNEFKDFMTNVFKAIATIIHSTAVGPTSPPLNAALFTGPLTLQLNQLLSHAAFTKRTP